MKFLSLLFLIIIVSILSSCGDSENDVNSKYTFTFNPPDSITFTSAIISERAQHGGPQVILDSTFTFTSHVLIATENGFEITTKSDSMRLVRNGQLLDDPVANHFSTGTFLHTIDSNGQALSLKGYDELFERLDEIANPETVAAVRQQLSPELLEGKEVDEWNEKVFKYVGKMMEIGQIEYSQDPFNLPGDQSVTYYRALKFRDTVTVDSKKCARLWMLADTNPLSLATRLEVPVETIMTEFKINDSIANLAAGSLLSSKAEMFWVFEISTMLTLSDFSQREIQLITPSDSGQASITGIFESQNKRVTY